MAVDASVVVDGPLVILEDFGEYWTRTTTRISVDGPASVAVKLQT
jgi:hypothetical protein